MKLFEYARHQVDQHLDGCPSCRRAVSAMAALEGGPLDLTRTGVVVGTPAYMPPEQLEGARVDAASDQYSYSRLPRRGLAWFERMPEAGRALADLRGRLAKAAPLERERPGKSAAATRKKKRADR